MIRRAAAAVATMAALLVLAAPAPPPAGAGAASTASRGQAAGSPAMSLVDQPIAVEPDGAFTVFLAVDDAPTATHLAVDLYGAVQPGEVVGVQPTEGSIATFPTVPLGAEVGGRRTAFFTIHPYPEGQPNPDPAWGFQITEPGVYPIRIRLWDGDDNTLTTMFTSMIRLPQADQTVAQTNAALLVPVHRAPPSDPQDRAHANAADQSLLDELAPVLDELATKPDLPATFSVTPDTIARVAGDPDAATDLLQLRDQLRADHRDLLDAPYVDIDAASLVGAGLASTLELERDLGRKTLRDLLGAPTAGTWQLHDRVDPATLAQLRTRGVFRTLVPGDALRSGAGVEAPVDLPAGDGTVRALSVSDLYALGRQAPDDPVLAAHRLLARLASAGPGPTGSPGIVVTVDPATVDPASLRLVTDALAFGTPFFAATGVPDLLDSTPARGRVELATPRPSELGTYPFDLRRAEGDLASYETMVGGRSELIRPYELRLAVSAARDLDLAQREHDARSVSLRLKRPFTAISMPEKDKITLGAQVATFPLPIESTLKYDVKVVIELEANDRIEFPKNQIERTLHPGRNELSIPVRTRAAGDTPVRITVRSPDGGVTLAQSQYSIRSTAVSGVGIVLTVGAALFLAIWWGRHWRRNRGTARELRHSRRARHEAVVAAAGGIVPPAGTEDELLADGTDATEPVDATPPESP